MQDPGDGLREASITGRGGEDGNQAVDNRGEDGVPSTIRTVTRGGQTYTMNVSRIGKRSVPPPSFAEVRVEDAKPDAEPSPPSPFGAVIILSSGDRMLVSEACNPRWLVDVIRALRSGPC